MTKDSLSYKIDTIFFCNAGPCKQKWQAEIFKNTSIFSNNEKKYGGGVKRERYIQAHELCTHYNSVAFILSSILQVMKKSTLLTQIYMIKKFPTRYINIHDMCARILVVSDIIFLLYSLTKHNNKCPISFSTLARTQSKQ